MLLWFRRLFQIAIPKMLSSGTKGHGGKWINIPRCLLWRKKSTYLGVWFLAYLLNITHITWEWLFKYAVCSDAGTKSTWNTGVFYFFFARGLTFFFVVFFKTQPSYLKIFMCVWKDGRFLYIVLWNLSPPTLLHSHTSFSMGQNDSVFLYNHQFTNPQGFYMARLMITFQFSKIWGETALTLYQQMKQLNLMWTLYQSAP